jgi:hypothetical protein
MRWKKQDRVALSRHGRHDRSDITCYRSDCLRTHKGRGYISCCCTKFGDLSRWFREARDTESFGYRGRVLQTLSHMKFEGVDGYLISLEIKTLYPIKSHAPSKPHQSIPKAFPPTPHLYSTYYTSPPHPQAHRTYHSAASPSLPYKPKSHSQLLPPS